MDEKQFREHIRELGYDEPQLVELPPGADGEMHTHPFSYCEKAGEEGATALLAFKVGRGSDT